jgi:hypothetical protein
VSRLNEKELRKMVFLRLKNEIYDEFGVYKHPIEPTKLKSFDLYNSFENYGEIKEIIDEEYENLRKFPISILDFEVVRIEKELLKIKEEMIQKNEYERSIRRKQFSRRGINNITLIQAFDILSKKYKLIESKEGLYLYVLTFDEINDKENVMRTNWFFKEYNTQFYKFMTKSEKILVLEELFLVPIVHKISRGKKKGIYSHYIFIDNGLQEIYLYTVNDFRYLERRSSLYKLLNNLYSKGRTQLFIESLIDKAPKIAYNNNIIMKSIFNGKIGNFYRSNALIER